MPIFKLNWKLGINNTNRMVINKEVFRAYDIRGSSLMDITPIIAYRIGFCFASMNISSNNKKICVGRDGRVSSQALCNSLIEGLTAGGAEIIYIGLVPTPALYWADKQYQPAASIMVTASHNPKNDNGFKMVCAGKSFFENQIQQLLDQILATDWVRELPSQKSNITNIDVTDSYLTHILKNINIHARLKIVWDPGNGATSDITQILANKLPNHNIVINNIIDGNFPNRPPDPTKAENLQQILKIIQEQNCDAGIAFDGDGDRIVVISKNGTILLGDQLLYILSKDIIKNNSKAKIIADVKTSQMILEQIEAQGAVPIMHRTGHPYIKTKMQETGALLAGEMSGHIFFAENYGYDDGIYAALRLLDFLSKSGKSLDEMLEELPRTFSTPEIKIKVADNLKFKIIGQIKQELVNNNTAFNDIDGIRVNNIHGWWLLRSSNTEAAIIARAESLTQSGLEVLKNTIRLLLEKNNLAVE